MILIWELWEEEDDGEGVAEAALIGTGDDDDAVMIEEDRDLGVIR